MNFGKAIKIIRSVKDLEQQEFARKVGLDSSYISLIEGGKRRPADRAIEKISKKLSIPKNLIFLLASEKEDLGSLSEQDSSKIGKQLLEILVYSSNNARP